MAINNKQKAVIHVAKQQLGMTDPEYRALLLSVGARSSIELTPGTFRQVMDRFKKMGFASKPKQKRIRGKFDRHSLKTRDRLLSKIEAQILDMGLSWRYADGIAERMFKIDLVEFCDVTKLQKIVTALAYHQKRFKKKVK